MIAAPAAFLAMNGGRTPGKAAMGLRVDSLSGFRDALRHEAIRWIPFVGFHVIAQLSLALPTFPRLWTDISRFVLIVLAWATVWYYLLPVFALNGDDRARWDKIVGSRVVSTG